MSLRKAFLAAVVIALVSLVAAEIALRLVTLVPIESAGFVRDPAIGFRHRPGMQSGELRLNSRGFNDAEWPTAGAPGATRIAFVGDSFTFGQYRHTKLFPYLATARLRELAPTEGVSLGVNAVGPPEYVQLIARDAAEFRAGIVVVVFYLGNDILQSHPRFAMALLAGTPAFVPTPTSIPRGVDELRLYRVARRMQRTFLENRRDPCIDRDGGTLRALLDESTLWAYTQELEVFRRAPVRAARHGIAGVPAAIGSIVTAARGIGATPVFVLAPTRMQFDGAMRRGVLACLGESLQEFDFEGPVRTVREALGRLGVPYLDLTPAFAAGDPDRLYRPHDTHWTEAGNALVAEAVADFLLRSVLDPGRRR
jgi:hypothetical protein